MGKANRRTNVTPQCTRTLPAQTLFPNDVFNTLKCFLWVKPASRRCHYPSEGERGLSPSVQKKEWKIRATATVSAETLRHMHTRLRQAYTHWRHTSHKHAHVHTSHMYTYMCIQTTHVHTRTRTYTCPPHSHQPIEQSMPSADLAAHLDPSLFIMKYLLSMNSSHAHGEWSLRPSTQGQVPFSSVPAPQPE